MLKKAVSDLFELRQKYYENAVENFKLSNEMSRNFQIIITTAVLAELAFIGTLGFDHNEVVLAAIAATILFISLIVFLVGISVHQVVVQDTAKDSLKMATVTDEYIRKHKKQYAKELPDELKSDMENHFIKRINRGSRILRLSYILIAVASILLVIMLWRLVL